MRTGRMLLFLSVCMLAFQWAVGDPLLPAAGEPYEGGTVIRFPGTESGMTTEHMKTLLYGFIPYEGDIFLIPTQMPEIEENRYTLTYTAGSGEEAIKGRGMGILNHDGTGVIMFALGQSQLMEQYEELLNGIADSIIFTSEN